MARFITFNGKMNPRTIGFIVDYSGRHCLHALGSTHRDHLGLWLDTATAWGKLTVFSKLDGRDQSAEAAVYQDGLISALQPCGNASIAAAARLLGDRPAAQIVVSEPRSGYRYLCRCSQAGNGNIKVEGEVEFPLGSCQNIATDCYLETFLIDNYKVHVWTGASIPCFPSEELLGAMKVIQIDAFRRTFEFFNLHGKHGAVPITGYVILSRLLELGVLTPTQLPEMWRGDLQSERTEPGLRALRLPTRMVNFREVVNEC